MPNLRLIPTRLVLAAAVGTLVALDLVLKAWAARHLTAGRSIDLTLIQLKVTLNSGVAFGLGSGDPTGLLLGASAIVTVAVAVVIWRSRDELTVVELIGLAAAVAGGTGNLVDRAADGVVTDYLHTGWFPTFNLADILITLGVGALMISPLLADRQTLTKP